MKKSTIKFTKEYRKKLENNIKNLIPYLEARTGYKIRMNVVLDETHGFIYAVQLSADNFQTYSKFTILGTTKSAVKQEIVKSVLHLDFKYKQRGSTTKTITKRVSSSALTIMCCNCLEEMPVSKFHRNKFSEILRPRGGFSLYCNDCVMKQFSAIYHKSGFDLALLWLCGFYDRVFLKDLCDLVKGLPLTPIGQAKEFYRRLNLIKNRGVTFADTNLTEVISE